MQIIQKKSDTAEDNSKQNKIAESIDNPNIKIIKITESKYSGKRLDSIAHNFFKDITRSKLQKNAQFFLKKSQDFFEMKGKTKVNLGEIWKIIYKEEITKHEHLTPWNFPLEVLKETNKWVVINKPEEISVHPSASEKGNKTIINALLFQFGEKNLAKNSCEIDGETIERPGLVHRLDKGTSGVLLIAKNSSIHSYFQKNWKETKKIYYAIVNGMPPKKGKISSGIQRDSDNRQRMMASDSDKAKDAITYFEREQTSRNKKYSLLRIEIPTGRTHQIRVHLSSIGFPIIGDSKYKGEEAERMYLHAHELSFPEKNKNELITVQSPLPENFLRFFS